MAKYLPQPYTIHQPAPYDPSIPVVVQQPGQLPYYATPPQIIVMQAPKEPTLTPMTTRMIVGAGMGAGAAATFAFVGPMIILSIQTLAVTGMAIMAGAAFFAFQLERVIKALGGLRSDKPGKEVSRK